MKPLRGQFMKQNEHFLREHGAYKIAATPTPSLGFQTTIETFQMRYCMIFSSREFKSTVKLKSKKV